MKHLKYLVLGVLIALLSVPITFAQDENVPLSGFYLIDATLGGDIVDNGDDTYEMTLQGVLPNIYWMVATPEAYMGSADLLLLTTEWVSNPTDLKAHALLETGDVVLDITMSAPNYDDFLEEMVVTMTVEDVYTNFDDVEPEVPTFFEAGALAIVFDDEFEVGLAFGAEVMASEGRAPSVNEKKRDKAPSKSKSGRRGGN